MSTCKRCGYRGQRSQFVFGKCPACKKQTLYLTLPHSLVCVDGLSLSGCLTLHLSHPTRAWLTTEIGTVLPLRGVRLCGEGDYYSASVVGWSDEEFQALRAEEVACDY